MPPSRHAGSYGPPEQVQRRHWLLDHTAACARDLHPAVCELLSNGTAPGARFLNVARRILVDVRHLPAFEELLPEPGVSLADCWAPCESPSEPEVYARGVHAARLLAWCIGGRPEWASREEGLTVAALLHDVGYLALEKRKARRNAAAASREAAERHAVVGAALAAGLEGLPVELPFLVAQHHERLDGTGAPRQIQGNLISLPCRLIAVVVRLVELLDVASSARVEPPQALDGAECCLAAVRDLYREAERGELDLRLTENVLEQIEPGLPEFLRIERAPGGLWSPASLGPDQRRRRDGQAPVQGPHPAGADLRMRLRALRSCLEAETGRRGAEGP